MNISCNVVMDLLPLYHDGVCSEASKSLVNNHLQECTECRLTLDKMNNTAVERQLERERNDVVRHHSKIVKKRVLFWGLGIALFMILPPFLIMTLSGEWTPFMIPAMLSPIIIALVIGYYSLPHKKSLLERQEKTEHSE